MTYGDLRVVRLGSAARHEVLAIGEVDDLGVALGERAALVPGVDLDGSSSGKSQQEAKKSECLHLDCQRLRGFVMLGRCPRCVDGCERRCPDNSMLAEK